MSEKGNKQSFKISGFTEEGFQRNVHHARSTTALTQSTPATILPSFIGAEAPLAMPTSVHYGHENFGAHWPAQTAPYVPPRAYIEMSEILEHMPDKPTFSSKDHGSSEAQRAAQPQPQPYVPPRLYIRNE